MDDREILDETIVYESWIQILRRRIRHRNGGIQNYDIVNPATHSVGAIAFDEHGQVILVETYRFGPDRRLLELPAGGPKPGERLVDAMQRELLEETGYVGELEQIGSHLIAAEHGVTRHVFVARNCRKIQEPSLDQSEVDEGMKVVMLSVDAFKTLVRSGEITETAAGFMALDHLGLL